ncbi:hypothetical protein ACFSCZ_14215 [Siminovitchia sediminis]|uniref:Uncharacterized protein n=1 Tax=Siminovitchia sediminis TaxID=1274353 RepID=A0ABW4KLE6_9BACI
MNQDDFVTHYTDFSFQKFCDQTFGVNRGVYNTIDRCFYERGIKDITTRRKEILSFLQFVTGEADDKPSSRVRFGKGGLVMKLNEYWERRSLESIQSNKKSIKPDVLLVSE